jgi:hypothetical protein
MYWVTRELGNVPSSTTPTAPGRENTGLFRSRSANSRKMARECVSMTIRIRRSKSRLCASCAHCQPLHNRTGPRLTHHKEAVGSGHGALSCECDAQRAGRRLPDDIPSCALYGVRRSPRAELGTVLQFSKDTRAGFANRARCSLQLDFQGTPKGG